MDTQTGNQFTVHEDGTVTYYNDEVVIRPCEVVEIKKVHDRPEVTCMIVDGVSMPLFISTHEVPSEVWEVTS